MLRYTQPQPCLMRSETSGKSGGGLRLAAVVRCSGIFLGVDTVMLHLVADDPLCAVKDTCGRGNVSAR